MTMSLEFLRSVKSPKLTVIERDLLTLYPQLKWIPGHEFIESKFEHQWRDIEDKEERREKQKECNPLYIDRTEEGLKDNKFTVPRLVINTLLPILFQRKIGGKVVNYNSFSTYIKPEIIYEKGNAVKIEVIYGKQVLKKNEEMHLDVIPIDTVNYHFVYNKEKNQWLEVKEEVFLEASEKIEEAIVSDEVMKVIQNYIDYQEDFQSKLNEFVDNKAYAESIEYLQNLASTIRDYHELQNILCAVNDEHFELINTQINDFSNQIETYEEIIHSITDEQYEYKKLESLSVIRGRVLKLLKTESAYFVKNNNAYANIAELFKLTQKADSSRTPKWMEQLRQALISYAAEKRETYIVITEPSFVNYLKRRS